MFRIIVASGRDHSSDRRLLAKKYKKVAIFLVLVIQFIFLVLDVYFNVSVNREVRRNEKQIIEVEVTGTRELESSLLHSYCTACNFPVLFLGEQLCCYYYYIVFESGQHRS